MAEGYLNLPGSSGAYASAPDSAALSITGDVDLRARVTMADWTPSAATAFVAKWTASGSQQSYGLQLLTSGALSFVFSTTGANTGSSTSSATNGGAALATGITDGTTKWVGVRFDVNNGASGKSVFFYLSDDSVTWTQLGATQTSAGTVSIFDSTAILEVGSLNVGTGNFGIGGKIHRVQIRNNILDDGTGIVFDSKFAAQAPGVTSFVESSSNAATVTINGSASLVGDSSSFFEMF